MSQKTTAQARSHPSCRKSSPPFLAAGVPKDADSRVTSEAAECGSFRRGPSLGGGRPFHKAEGARDRLRSAVLRNASFGIEDSIRGLVRASRDPDSFVATRFPIPGARIGDPHGTHSRRARTAHVRIEVVADV